MLATQPPSEAKQNGQEGIVLNIKYFLHPIKTELPGRAGPVSFAEKSLAPPLTGPVGA